MKAQLATEISTLSLREWVKFLRLHQWSKNLVIFIPFVLNHQFASGSDSIRISLAFFLFGLVASATYLFNDLCDLEADRRHPVKRYRAIAAGRVSTATAKSIATVLFVAGIVGAAMLDANFLLAMIGYTALTVAYSLRLKQLVLTDTFVIALLFAVRVIIGMVISHQPISIWLCSFTIMLFLSLALAKRHGELVRSSDDTSTSGRSYTRQDLPVTVSFGITAAMAAIVIMVLYLTFEAEPKNLYRTIGWLYVVPLVVMSWTQRIWFLANRGILHDDPVVFALKDPISWFHAVAVGLAWVLAVVA